MKKQLQQFSRFFLRSKKYHATAARAAVPETYEEEDDGGSRLSGAFIIVLLLHVVAVVGVFAFARIKDSRNNTAASEPPSTQTAATKAKAAKPAAAKPVVANVAAKPDPTPAPLKEFIRAPQPGARQTHVVLQGETLSKIAFAFNVGVSDLVAANKLSSPGDIRVGQALTIPEAKQTPKIPAAADTKPATTVASTHKPSPPASDRKTAKAYTVKKGDTAARIAREHGCTYDDLVKLNNIKDPKKIQPGQVLKLPVKNG